METATATDNQARNALLAIQAVADCIKEAGEIPAGHLYAALMGHGCTLDGFEQVVGILTSAKHGKPLVRRENDLLIWNAAPGEPEDEGPDPHPDVAEANALLAEAENNEAFGRDTGW